MAQNIEISMLVDTGAQSQVVDVTTGASAQSTVLNTHFLIVTPTVDCFVRRGANPVAVSTGADQLLTAWATYRLQTIAGQKLAFIALSQAGKVYISPDFTGVV